MEHPAVTIRLDPETNNALTVAAEREGVSRSVLVRRAIISLVVDLAAESTDD